MKDNIEELKQMLEELYRTQQARLDVGADDLDIREKIAEVEEKIKELQDETIEENSIEEDIKELKEMIDSDIESVGGVEGFNNYCCANECITSWIDRVLDIVERMNEK